MATIKKNKSGTWTATIYTGRDEKGKKMMEFITMDEQRECKAAARKRENELECNNTGKYENMYMSDYMDEWLIINKGLLAPTTLKGYRIHIKAHFKDYFGRKKVNKVTDMMIKKYMSQKLASGLSPTTVRKHFFTLSKMLGDALKTKNPCIGIKPPQNADFKPHVPTEQEFDDIYKAFKSISTEDEAIILFAGWCGLRRGEIFALKWDDLNEENGTIEIDEAVALEEDTYDFELKEPKSKNGIRTIVIPDYLIELVKDLKSNPPKFKRYKKNHKKNKGEMVEVELKKKPDIQPLIFRQDPHSFTKKYFRIIKEKNLPKVRFHDLRHYHATLMHNNKIDDLYAAERLGHDIWVLKKIYQHLGLKEKREQDDKIKNMFK